MDEWAQPPDYTQRAQLGAVPMTLMDQPRTFEDAEDAVLQSGTHSALELVARCADLYCGDGEATRAALAAGLV